MLQRLYDRVIALAASDRAPWWLAVIAFCEASFFPIPPDALLIPMALAQPRRAWRFAAICTLGSLVGAGLGYLIGYALFAQVAEPILRFYHYDAAFEAFRVRFAENGVYVILLKGLLPIPFKIVTIASGLSAMNVPAFFAACLATRGARFFLIAALIRRFGDPVRVFIERRLMLITTVSAVCIVLGFVLVRYI